MRFESSLTPFAYLNQAKKQRVDKHTWFEYSIWFSSVPATVEVCLVVTIVEEVVVYDSSSTITLCFSLSSSVISTVPGADSIWNH